MKSERLCKIQLILDFGSLGGLMRIFCGGGVCDDGDADAYRTDRQIFCGDADGGVCDGGGGDGGVCDGRRRNLSHRSRLRDLQKLPGLCSGRKILFGVIGGLQNEVHLAF